MSEANLQAFAASACIVNDIWSMPRAKTILQSQFPYHVTARCRNKDWFSLPLDQVWEIYSQQLTFMARGFSVKIHSFVLMNNHFHLLVTTPRENLSEAMAFFMRETTRSINRKTGRINQAYGGPYFRGIIQSTLYYLHAYKYIYANPVKGGLANRCEDYPYSSLHFLIGRSEVGFPMAVDDTLFSDIEGTLSWLNRQPDDELWEHVKQAMHKKNFKLAKVNYSRNESPLLKKMF